MKNNINKIILEKAKKVKILLLDFDGVMTNGEIYYDINGKVSKCFDIKDGLGIQIFKEAGFKIIILTNLVSKIVKKRAKTLNIKNVYEGIPDKVTMLNKIINKYNLKKEEICFIGDDVNDIEVAKNVGFSIAVNNAVIELKKKSDYITPQDGGKGAIRHIIEIILKSKNLWNY